MFKRLEYIEEILENFQRIRHSMAEGFVSQKKSPITPSQSFVLHFVTKQKESSVKEIAEKLQISSSAATQLIDALVKNGFLEREDDPEDRRSVILTVSEKTQKRFARIQEKGLQRMKDIFSTLSDEEIATYLRLTTKIADNLKK